MVREKSKNENVATFFDVYDVFASKFHHFSNFGMYFKVNHAFKAKTEAFREGFCAQVGNVIIFAHLTLQILGRDEIRFSMKIFQNLVPNWNFNNS